MSITGFPDSPPTRSGQSISDYYAGMLCAFSIVSALHYRNRTGKGQHIDMALLDSLITALDNLGERYTVGGEILTRKGNISFAGSSSGVYQTTDGHVAIAAGTSDLVWRRFCQIIGQPELAHDPQFATTAARRQRHDETAAIIQGWTRQRRKLRWCSAWRQAGVPAAPVNNVAEMVADPQIQAREMFVELEHPIYGPVKITGTPLKFSETPGRVERLAPLPGEHNEEIFVGMLGHTTEDLDRWQKRVSSKNSAAVYRRSCPIALRERAGEGHLLSAASLPSNPLPVGEGTQNPALSAYANVYVPHNDTEEDWHPHGGLLTSPKRVRPSTPRLTSPMWARPSTPRPSNPAWTLATRPPGWRRPL